MNAEMLDFQSAMGMPRWGTVEPYLRTARVQVDSGYIFGHNLSAFNSKLGVCRPNLENQFSFLQFWVRSKYYTLFPFGINGDFDEIDRVESRVDDSSASDDGFINNLGAWQIFQRLRIENAEKYTYSILHLHRTLKTAVGSAAPPSSP
jgi:hypothetical protein